MTDRHTLSIPTYEATLTALPDLSIASKYFFKVTKRAWPELASAAVPRLGPADEPSPQHLGSNTLVNLAQRRSVLEQKLVGVGMDIDKAWCDDEA